MKISKRQLRRIIKEELLHENAVKMQTEIMHAAGLSDFASHIEQRGIQRFVMVGVPKANVAEMTEFIEEDFDTRVTHEAPGSEPHLVDLYYGV